MKHINKDINPTGLNGRRAFLSKAWKLLGLVALGELDLFYPESFKNR